MVSTATNARLRPIATEDEVDYDSDSKENRPAGYALVGKWVNEKHQLFLLLVSFTAVLLVLAAASITAEAVTENRLCSETTVADEYCGRTMYSGYWGGALFATLNACIAIRLLFTRSNFNWRLWIKFNQGFAVLAFCAYAAMLGLNSHAMVTFYNKIQERAVIAEIEAKQSQPSNCDTQPSDCSRVMRAALTDIAFFIGCTWKLCIAGVLVLISIVLIFIPFAVNKSKPGQLLSPNPNLPSQIEEKSPLRKDNMAEEQLNKPTASDNVADLHVSLVNAAANDTLVQMPEVTEESNDFRQGTTSPTKATLTAITNEKSISDIPEINVLACMYEIAKSSTFCATLEAAYDVLFKSSAAYDANTPDATVKITCQQVVKTAFNQDELPNEPAVAKRKESHAIDALQRFIERCVQPSTATLTLRFPIILRDELGDAAIKYIRSAIDEALGGEGIRYAQLAVDKSAGEVGVLCSIEADGRGASGSGNGSRTKTEVSNEVEAEKRKSKALAAAEYAAHRRLRRVVEEVDELEKAFETREDVKVFRVVGGEHQNLRVFVYRGESWRVPGDFVVNGVNGSLEQAEGQTRQQGPGSGSGSGSGSGTEGKSDIESAAGGELRSELERVMRERRGRKLAVGEVVSTRAYRLAAGRILHVNVGGASSSSSSSGSAPGRREATAEEQRIELQQVYGAVFNAAAAEAPAEANDIRIALSLLGSEAAAATTTTTVTATTTGGRGRQGVDKVDESVEALLDVLTNGAGGALERFREVHIVEKEGEKTRKLEERAGSKELELRFARERSGAKVRLVKPGFQPFAYA